MKGKMSQLAQNWLSPKSGHHGRDGHVSNFNMNLALDHLPVNAFDLGIVLILGFGMLRGRKNGMSVELLNMLKWLAILFGCAAIYQPAGLFLAQSSPISKLACFLIMYTAVAAVVFGLFALIKNWLGGKLLGSDLFGRAEYYLGMGSGVIRFACILVFLLALLNAPFFNPMKVRAMEKFQNDMYGSNFFPGLHSLQSTVFEKSMSGPWIKEHLDFLLIKPTESEEKNIQRKEYQLP
jgi:uncharacterized membrane protein required for colicin V production